MNSTFHKLAKDQAQAWTALARQWMREGATTAEVERGLALQRLSANLTAFVMRQLPKAAA